jgi:hypothetical protein
MDPSDRIANRALAKRENDLDGFGFGIVGDDGNFS